MAKIAAAVTTRIFVRFMMEEFGFTFNTQEKKQFLTVLKEIIFEITIKYHSLDYNITL